ncbi:hypothetical protein D3C72_1414950 [compost metagenome]
MAALCHVVERGAVDRFRIKDRQTTCHHGGDAAGHCKSAIVRLGRHQQRKGVIAVDCVLIKTPGFVAGNHQVIAFGDKLICQLNGSNAFWAIAGTGE